MATTKQVQAYINNPANPAAGREMAANVLAGRKEAATVVIAIGYTAGKKKGRWAKIQVPANLLEVMYPVGAHLVAADGNDYEVFAHCD